MISCTGLTVEYGSDQDGVVVLKDLTWRSAAKSISVVGPSGSGKSTFLRVLAGLQKPTKGFASIGESKVLAKAKGRVDSRASLVYQDFRLIDFLTVFENVRVAADLSRATVSDEEITSALERVGISELAARRPGRLSGGQQQRAAIARAVVTRSQLLLADEPTGALDAKNSAIVANLLVDLADEQSLTCVIATHDRQVADLAQECYAIIDSKLERLR